ncbi:hypothetical protein [Porphyrobacter sp. AAP60]|uniref:hypothetical protein n=1 Tax=Porphyrobacter sp. AAP60 TaxID=1523423 RepID=UPI0006B8F6E2|nr:hypothetical protein [Porphyrobacter sp. AAP60]KPF63278.1 hypothetical protein IP79_10335 [Porphyrobacter sp. AAP60]
MTSSLIFIFLIGLGLSFVAIANAKGAKLFTFAFLFPTVTVAFVLVEFSDFVLNAGTLFDIYYQTGTINIALFMLATCSIAGLVGYGFTRSSSAASTPLGERFILSRGAVQHMHFASIALGAVSLGAFFALAGLGGGMWQYVLNSGSYAIEWSGLPVYLIFLVRLCYVSIVIQLWLWSYTRKRKHLIWALFLSIIPLINILFLFRRAEAIKVGVFYGYFLTNYHGLKMGRIKALGGIVFMYLAFKLFPFLRSEEGKSRDADDLIGEALSPRATYENSEIGSGLVRIYHSMETGVFEYGAVFYNAFIKQFVPAGLFGPQAKDNLYLPVIENSDTYFTTFRFYVSPMGFAQAYQQFWIFGGVLFLIVGSIMAALENNARKSKRAEIFLVLMIPVAISTVSADMTYIVPQFVIYLVMVLLCVPPPSRARRGAPPRHE